MPVNLDETLHLRTAGTYSFPGDATAVLPRVYGYFLDANAGDLTSSSIATPAVLIDTQRWVYCLNDGPSALIYPFTIQPLCFYNGVLQENSVFSLNYADDYEGKGLITTATFAVNPTHGTVSFRLAGLVDGAGALITNPILAIYDVLTKCQGWTLNDFDRAICGQTLRDLSMLYPDGIFWCFQDVTTTLRTILMELFAAYHCDVTENGQGQLAIALDRSLTTFTVAPDYQIPAYEVADGGEPAAAVQLEMHSDDVCNQVTLHGRENWATHEETADYTWDYPQSQNAYQGVYPLEFTHRGMYTLTHATQWLNSFALRHGFDPTVVTFTLDGLKFIPLIPPRAITLEWPLYGWSEHLLKIRKTVVNFRNQTVTLECVDCQRELSDVVTNPNASPALRLRQLARSYNWLPGTAGAQGNLNDPPRDPRNQCLNGSFEDGDNGQWDLYTSQAQKQWTIIEEPTESYGGRFYARHVPGAGDGSARSLRQRIDPAQYYVVSGRFRQHTAGTDGQACISASFYDQTDTFIGIQRGTYVVPTDNYLESVAFGVAPAGSFYYRSGLDFILFSYPTTGQWRADQVFAFSGSLQEVVASRQGDLVSRNPVLNGDFELGPVAHGLGGGWVITNDPAAAAHSGIWKAVHFPTIGGSEERQTPLTKLSVTVGQTFTLQAWVMTLNNPNGTGRLGVTWMDAQGNSLAENFTGSTSGPFAAYTLASGSMSVPLGALYAQVWIGITGHTLANTYWLIDDIAVY